MNYRTHKILKLIKKDLNDSKHRVNPYYVAGVHTAILTILLATVTHYTLIYSARYQNLEAEVYKQAEQINKLSFLPTMYFPKDEIYHLSGKNVELSNKLRTYCLDLAILLSEISPNPRNILISGNPIPKDPSERAELAVGLSNVIEHSYPFPKTIELFPNAFLIKPRAEAIEFNSISDVQKWLVDLQEINQFLGIIRDAMPIHYPKKIMSYFKALNKKNKIVTEKEDILASEGFDERDPFIIFKNFRANLINAQAIEDSVKKSLRKLDKFKVNIPREGILKVGFVGIFIVFVIGVIWPMLINRVNKLFQIWVPSIFYLIAYGYIIYFTISKIKQI